MASGTGRLVPAGKRRPRGLTEPHSPTCGSHTEQDGLQVRSQTLLVVPAVTHSLLRAAGWVPPRGDAPGCFGNKGALHLESGSGSQSSLCARPHR